MTEVALDQAGGARPRWHRVVLKLSGEALASSLSDETIDASTVGRLAKEIGSAQSELDIQIAIVVGGGVDGVDDGRLSIVEQTGEGEVGEAAQIVEHGEFAVVAAKLGSQAVVEAPIAVNEGKMGCAVGGF